MFGKEESSDEDTLNCFESKIIMVAGAEPHHEANEKVEECYGPGRVKAKTVSQYEGRHSGNAITDIKALITESYTVVVEGLVRCNKS